MKVWLVCRLKCPYPQVYGVYTTPDGAGDCLDLWSNVKDLMVLEMETDELPGEPQVCEWRPWVPKDDPDFTPPRKSGIPSFMQPGSWADDFEEVAG